MTQRISLCLDTVRRKGARRSRWGDDVRRTEILQVDGPVIPVNYALFFRDEQWKVFDVTIEGVSLVQNYRAQFGDIARADGLDALIERVQTGTPGALE